MTTEQRLSEMKPCPFCGVTPELTEELQYNCKTWDYWVKCRNEACPVTDCCTSTFPTEAEAIAAWNTRSDTTLRASEARAEESEKAHEADTVAAAELIDLLHTRVATAEADAKALRQRLAEIHNLMQSISLESNGYTRLAQWHTSLSRIAALAAIQDGDGK